MQGEKMWATFAQLGYNVYGDQIHRYVPSNTALLSTAVMRADEPYWKDYTEKLVQNGCNTLIVEVAEALQYESHPELAIEGSWTREQMQKELARLRTLGFTEIIPKLNFGAGHDIWLKHYDHMLSSKLYYEVTADLIREVIEVFGAKHIHLGMDEEHYRFQNPKRRGLAIIRRGNAWWHDLYHYIDCAERQNARPWVWSDPVWYNPDEFFAKMPKSVVQCNWYYGERFENPTDDGDDHNDKTYLRAFELLEEHGFDQMPTGSNVYGAEQNLLDMTKFCRERIAPDRFLGLMDAPWAPITRTNAARLERSAVHLGEARAWFEATKR